ncbi:hypothetical protein LCGC14_1925970, partial [marine sediment metagenome]
MNARAAESPSGTLPWVGVALMGLPGSAVAAYLTYAHWADRPTVCGGIGECELVQTSEYSDIAGVPVAFGDGGNATVIDVDSANFAGGTVV